MPRLKVLFVVSECVPFAKTGGLADVGGALPMALAARGHDVRVVLPRYQITKKHPAERLPAPLAVPVGGGEAWCGVWETRFPRSNARVYLLEHDALYDRDGIYGDKSGDFGDNLARYTLLSRGALQLCRYLDFLPDVIHAHDWQTALAPVYLNTLDAGTPLARAASVFTIHNMGYQGWFSKEQLWQTRLGWEVFHQRGLEAHDSINLLKGGIYHATLVTTVSPRYAREIQTSDGGEGLDGALRDRGGDVLGILNGIDDDLWSPQKDKHTAAPFTPEDLEGKALCKAALQAEMGLPQNPDAPIVAIVSRLAHQKGIDVFAGALPDILSLGAQVVVLGSGEKWAEDLFRHLHATHPRFKAHIGMNEPLSHRIEAGADLFIMPSRYEPCGLNQLYSQRYGTLPIVRAVGGLDDTIEHDVTGFKFRELDPRELSQAVANAIYTYHERPEHFRRMQYEAMRKPMGWSHASRQYEALYRLAIARRRGGG
ncbi:Glycogen synthase, ADP-glucose transglucosylase [Minicystis rosea]|nr:Glycogen synthase, ADP-glucose transglucosylase [Minicystis rosea]